MNREKQITNKKNNIGVQQIAATTKMAFIKKPTIDTIPSPIF
jgi:hypothetical protein